MGNINLTDIQENMSGPFSNLSRLDNLIIASKLESDEQINWLLEQDVKLAIDMKESGESNFPDEEKLRKAGIDYYHFPVSNLDDLDLDELIKLNKLIMSSKDKQLVYCMSGNRVAAVLALVQALVCGHPKRRAYEMALKVGMNKEGLKEKVLIKLNL